MPKRAEPLLTGAELTRSLGVSRSWVSKCLDSGLPFWTNAKGRKLFYVSEALAWRAQVARGEIKRWYPPERR